MGNIPDKDHQSEVLVTYGGSVSSYGNKFVSTMASFGYIACYEQQADGTCKILWDACAEQPIYKKDQLDLTLLKLGFADVKMTKIISSVVISGKNMIGTIGKHKTQKHAGV